MTISKPEDAYKIVRIVLKLSGSWPKHKTTIFYTFRKILNFLSINTLIVLLLIRSLQDIRGVEDISHSTFMNLECWAYVPKLIIFYYKKNELLAIFELIKDPMLQMYDEDLDIYMQRRIKIFVTLTTWLFSFACVSLTLIGFLPFVGSEFTWEAPLPIPIDFKRYPVGVYIFVWIYLIILFNISALTNGSMDILACSFMGITSAHLEILREQLKRVANINVKKNMNEIEYLHMYGRNDEEVLVKIRKCVEYHDAIERLVLAVDDIFNISFLIQLTNSVVVICLTCFSFILFPITSLKFIVSFLFFSCIFIQIVIYCAFGNDVIVQSSKIADACYMSEWWMCGTEVRKSLFIIMERAKRPYQFTAGKFIIISLSSFLTLCKSSFSYMTMLNTFYGKSAEGD